MNEKEVLALVLALKHFEVYVGSASAPTVIYTNHNPLIFINQMQNTNQRLMLGIFPSVLQRGGQACEERTFWPTRYHVADV